MLNEDVLDGVVDAGHIGVNEKIGVFTRMGNPVTQGIVLSTSPQGLVVKEDDGSRFFRSNLHMFVPLDDENAPFEPLLPIMQPVMGVDPDFEVDMKLGEATGLADKMKTAAASARAGVKSGAFGKKKKKPKPLFPKKSKDTDDGDDGEEKSKGKNGDDKKAPPFGKKPTKKGDEEPEGDEMSGGEEEEGSVDVATLPQDIQQHVTTTKELNDEQVNRVISDMGDAGLTSLKRVKIAESEIYGLVDEMQKAITQVLNKFKGTP